MSDITFKKSLNGPLDELKSIPLIYFDKGVPSIAYIGPYFHGSGQAEELDLLNSTNKWILQFKQGIYAPNEKAVSLLKTVKRLLEERLDLS